MTRPIHIALAVPVLALGLVVGASRSHAAAQTETMTFTAALSPANEVPPITNDESKGSGEATIVFHVTRDASKAISAATADITVTLKAFPPGTTLTAAHIHRGAAGTNGGVVVNPMFNASEMTLTGGSGSFSKTGVTVPQSVATEILANAGNFYFNVHTAMNASGVARGPLTAAK